MFLISSLATRLVQSISSQSVTNQVPMGKKYRSPAKISRSLNRILEYKIYSLEDLYNLDVCIERDEKSVSIISWNVTKDLKLRPEAKIVETRAYYNPSYQTMKFGDKLQAFQNMWYLTQSSFLFFSCMLGHCRRNSSKCDQLCSQFAMPECGNLTHFFATNTWPD